MERTIELLNHKEKEVVLEIIQLRNVHKCTICWIMKRMSCSQNHRAVELRREGICWIMNGINEITERRDLLNHEWNMIFTKRRYMIFTITKRFCLICSLKSEKQNECGKLKVKLGFSSNSSLKSEGKQKWK
jgi:hypothetical protein